MYQTLNMDEKQDFNFSSFLISNGFTKEVHGKMQLFQFERKDNYYALTIHDNEYFNMASVDFLKNNQPIPKTHEEALEVLRILLK